jgi:dihydrofolate reductase
MGRLIVSVQTTLDGVIDQEREWMDLDLDPAQHGVEQLRAAEALILGRETYERLAAYWPPADGPYAELINPMPKHVASRTLSEPLAWNARLLGPDVGAAVAALKDEHTGTLLLYGCGQLANDLAHLGLVDEVRLWVQPVVWGDGARTFRPGALPMRMRLIGTATYPTGLVRLSYQPVA